MEISVIIGSFLAVSLIAGVGIFYIKRKLTQFSSQFFGTTDFLNALSELNEKVDTPRSLNGFDDLLLPKILKDFPDYDAALAKTYVRKYLQEWFYSKDSLMIHNIVTSKYLPSAAHKTIVFQAAVSWLEDGIRVQKRFELHYSYILAQSSTHVAANCPNCGGAMDYGVSVCPYCNSRVANVLGNSWEFTQITER